MSHVCVAPADDTGSWVDARSRSEALRARVLSLYPTQPQSSRENGAHLPMHGGGTHSKTNINEHTERRNTKKGREQNAYSLRARAPHWVFWGYCSHL